MESIHISTAEAYLELLSLRGVDYFFANPGTDFTGIIEAFAHRQRQGKTRPLPVTVPHEIPLVCMAQGYYLATGKPQAVMVHVGIGTANALGGLMAANRGRIPILFNAGRTPITEQGTPSSRSGYIHWGQEMYDQAAMVREFVKWDYELRTPAQLETVVDRALTLCMTDPKGPVYLTLPREVLAASMPDIAFQKSFRFNLPTFHPEPEKIQKAADLLASAKFPVIITSSIGRTPGAVENLVTLAEEAAIAVISMFPEYMNFPPTHPCFQGNRPNEVFEKADIILVIDCDVPWFPNQSQPGDKAVIIQAGIDPLYSRYPIRGFRSDWTIQGNPEQVLKSLLEAMANHPGVDRQVMRARMDKLKERHASILTRGPKPNPGPDNGSALEYLDVTQEIGRIVDKETVVFDESINTRINRIMHIPGSYFYSPHAGYLGWGLGAALGYKLGNPEKTLIATMGDGSYLFSVPSACHHVSQSLQIPILVIIYNNQAYGTVKRTTKIIYPEGWAAHNDLYPLTSLEPPAHYEKICEAFGGYGEKVESRDQLAPALQRALHAVKQEKRQAVLNMVVKPG